MYKKLTRQQANRLEQRTLRTLLFTQRRPGGCRYRLWATADRRWS
jgi:hypothetical protein